MSSTTLLPTPQQATYSFVDLVGSLDHPSLTAPLYISGGNIGIGTLTIRMLTQRTEHEVAADGVVMPSYIAGANAEVTIECQQTSALHHTLLNLYNVVTSAADAGDLTQWAAASMTFRTVLDGSGHYLSGVSFQRIPDKPYAARGQNIHWVLMCANAQNI